MKPTPDPPTAPEEPWSPAARAAVARFDPRPTRLRRWSVRLVAVASRGLMRIGNRVTLEGAERLDEARIADRGLLTFSNHVSLFDDPWLTACLSGPEWKSLRWIAADALNFFGSPWKAALFNSGKCVPVVRGAGVEQPGMVFLAERLRAGEWVHVFPEAGRTRDPAARLRLPFRGGLAALVRASAPLLLPFYHRGMEAILPIGARWPRLGHEVRLRFGEVRDSRDGLTDAPAAEITAWAEGRLLELQGEVRGETSGDEASDASP